MILRRQLKQNSGQRVTIDWRLDAQTAGNAAIDVGEKWDVVSAYAFTEEIAVRGDGTAIQSRRAYRRDRDGI